MLLLAQDELVDVLLCLGRLHILMAAFASRKLRTTVDALPPNSCLILLSEVVLTRKCDSRWHEPGSVRSAFQRIMLKCVRPYKLQIYPSSDDLKWVTRRSRSSSKIILAFLSAIRNANVYSVRIDLPQLSQKLEQMLRLSATTTGRIQEIVVHIDCQRVPPSVVEVLPLLAAEVASLQFSYQWNKPSQPTPAHQSEKLLRNCIDRGVYSLKLMDKERHCRVPYAREEQSSDISEESILEFCFVTKNIRPERPKEVELWLNWIDLSPEFLSRFIQASEACDSNHKVKLMLRGANVCNQDLSQFRIHDPSGRYSFGANTWTNEGKCAVRVVRNLQLGFFFAHRSTLPFDEWYYDNEGFFPVELDAWIFVRPAS